VVPHFAAAATYSDDITVDPSTLNCGYYATAVIFGGYTGLLGEATVLKLGDQLNESVTYTSPVVVPGSPTGSVLYNGLVGPAFPAGGGPAIPGPDVATGPSTLAGYTGPVGPFLKYTTSEIWESI
jgi:hypothetical protein